MLLCKETCECKCESLNHKSKIISPHKTTECCFTKKKALEGWRFCVGQAEFSVPSGCNSGGTMLKWGVDGKAYDSALGSTGLFLPPRLQPTRVACEHVACQSLHGFFYETGSSRFLVTTSSYSKSLASVTPNLSRRVPRRWSRCKSRGCRPWH